MECDALWKHQFQVQSYKFSPDDAALVHVSQYLPANMQMSQL